MLVLKSEASVSKVRAVPSVYVPIKVVVTAFPKLNLILLQVESAPGPGPLPGNQGWFGNGRFIDRWYFGLFFHAFLKRQFFNRNIDVVLITSW